MVHSPSAPLVQLYPKPKTDWQSLQGPVETSTQYYRRVTGRVLTTLAVPLTGATAYSYHYLTGSPRTVIRVTQALFLATLGFAITGLSLWFFNRLTRDPEKLLSLRKQAGEEIENNKLQLAEIYARSKDPLVVSREELNDWIRYLLEAQGYAGFIEKQPRIFELKNLFFIETIVELKTAFTFFRNSNPREPLAEIERQGAFQNLFTSAEQEVIRMNVRNTLAATAASWDEYLQNGGIEGLAKLEPATKERAFALFRVHIENQKMGIEDLKKNHPKELIAFQDMLTPLYQSIAIREASEHACGRFIERNSQEAIQHLDSTAKQSFFPKFLDYVRSETKMGFNKAKEQFKTALDHFGANAYPALANTLADHDWIMFNASVLSYKEFRERNSFEQFQLRAIGRAELLKPKFLALSPNDLVAEIYQQDRLLLGISQEDVTNELKARWKFCTLAQILKNDRDAFLATIPFMGPTGYWYEKAFQETALLQLRDILEQYADLITTNVLNPAFIAKKIKEEIRSIPTFESLFDTFGEKIFTMGLLTKEHISVKELVKGFIRNHARYYLGVAFTPAPAITELQLFIQKHNLLPDADRIKKLIAEWSAHVKSLVENYHQSKESLPLEHQKKLKEIDESTEAGISELQNDPTLRRITARLQETEAVLRNIETNAKIEQEEEKIQQELERLQREISTARSKIGEVASALQAELETLPEQVAGWEIEEKELSAKITKLQPLLQEQERLAKAVKPEEVKAAPKGVTGYREAKRQEEMKKDAERLYELNGIFAKEENNLSKLVKEHVAIKAKLASAKDTIDTAHSKYGLQALKQTIAKLETQIQQNEARKEALRVEKSKDIPMTEIEALKQRDFLKELWASQNKEVETNIKNARARCATLKKEEELRYENKQYRMEADYQMNLQTAVTSFAQQI